MAYIVTVVSIVATLAAFLYYVFVGSRPRGLVVSIRLDRSTPGAHLIWDIANGSDAPLTITKLIVYGKSGTGHTVALGLPKVLQPHENILLPTDVDWTVLGARSIAVSDADGREYVASHRQLANIQERLRNLIDRREYSVSARDWLFGATDLAFGVVILGLGFFMLMWVIATG